MNIRSARTKEELKEVLQNPTSNGPDIAYWVFTDVSEGKWENMTVTTPKKYGDEYAKTYGHYHTSSSETEVYKLISGKGVFLLQKKHYNEKGELVPNKVDEVFLVHANVPNEEIVVPTEYGHSWSNVGKEPLVTFDNWRWNHKPTDYTPIKDMQGMAYYLIDEDGTPKAIPNPKYVDLPKPQWTTPKEWAKNVTSLVQNQNQSQEQVISLI